MSIVHNAERASLHHRARKSSLSISIAAARPVLLKEPKTSPKISLLGKDRSHLKESVGEDDDAMATGFPSFCTFCEKQIVIPGNSILYCSESCRRMDSHPSLESGCRSPTDKAPLLEFAPKRSPVPRMPSALTSLDAKPPVLHNGKADLDPTEWKPCEPRIPAGAPPPSDGLPRRPSSEASMFLGKFHRSDSPHEGRRRPALRGRSTASFVSLMTGSATTPGLTLNSTASSSESSLVGTPEDDSSLGSGGLIIHTKASSRPQIKITPPPTYADNKKSPVSGKKMLLSEKIASMADYSFGKNGMGGSIENDTADLERASGELKKLMVADGHTAT